MTLNKYQVNKNNSIEKAQKQHIRVSAKGKPFPAGKGTEKVVKPTITYKAKGYVLGKLWGGGMGWYPSKELEGKSLEEIKKQAKEGVKTGSLDSGMGYEKLTGAVLDITIIETRIIDGRAFRSHDYEQISVGNLSPEDIERANEIMIG